MPPLKSQRKNKKKAISAFPPSRSLSKKKFNNKTLNLHNKTAPVSRLKIKYSGKGLQPASRAEAIKKYDTFSNQSSLNEEQLRVAYRD